MYAIAEKVSPWTKRVIKSLTPHCSRLQTSLRRPTSNCEMCTSSIAPVSRRRMCWRTIENTDVLYDYHSLSTGNPEAIASLFVKQHSLIICRHRHGMVAIYKAQQATATTLEYGTTKLSRHLENFLNKLILGTETGLCWRTKSYECIVRALHKNRNLHFQGRNEQQRGAQAHWLASSALGQCSSEIRWSVGCRVSSGGCSRP